LCNLIECFLSESYGFKKGEKYEVKKRYIDHAFAFAFIWSIGATVYESNYDKVLIKITKMYHLFIFIIYIFLVGCVN
jgi:UDP-N-acetylmuramyl pentapeptide phosphotransferase/UDP-N-acetylglucosamine-1-phosphate transferase